jgi:hypothetical protein
MSRGKGWDLSSLHSLEGGADWIRKNSGAVLVLVVRGEDVAFSVDARVAPAAAREMVECVLPEAAEQLNQRRIVARDQAAQKQAAHNKKQGTGSRDQGSADRFGSGVFP